MQQTRLVRGTWRCPKCSGALVFRQVIIGTDGRGRRQWADDMPFCTRGCPLTSSSHRQRHPSVVTSEV
jgi:hypothetical protein